MDMPWVMWHIFAAVTKRRVWGIGRRLPWRHATLAAVHACCEAR
jgi:hypothetical protein